MRRDTTERTGLTLIESLVLVGVVAVLTGIFLTALRPARLSAHRTAALAHQRGLSDTLRAYATDNDDRFPYWGTPGTAYAPLVIDDHLVSMWHWGHIHFWAAYLESRGYNGWAARQAGSGPARNAERPIGAPFIGPTIHLLSNTLYTTDRYWTDGWDYSASDYTGRRFFEIEFPANKGVLHQLGSLPEGDRDDDILDRPGTRWILHFGDGHGETVPRSELLDDIVPRPFTRDWPVYSTRGGLKGRDIR